MLYQGRQFPCLFISSTLHSTWHIIDSQEIVEWMSKQLLLFLLCANHCASVLLHPYPYLSLTTQTGPPSLSEFFQGLLTLGWDGHGRRQLLNQSNSDSLFPHLPLRTNEVMQALRRQLLEKKFSHHVPHVSKHSLHRLLFFSLPICTPHLKKTISKGHHPALKFLVLTSSHQWT